MLTVLILTPLPIEFEAVARHLSGEREVVFAQQTVYEIGYFKGKHHEYRVVICEPGMKNVDMALATERAVAQFDPKLALLVGIAGGVKDLKIGDVLVAEKVYGYESGKEDIDGYKSRPEVESFSLELLARARSLSRREEWKKRTLDEAQGAKVLLGAIAAGNKVLASIDNPTFQRLKSNFNDTRAVEMEAIGFAMAVQPHREVHALAIRGISDLCKDKTETDKDDWQPVAADRAAALAYELLWQLDTSDFAVVKSKPGPITPEPGVIRPPQPARASLGDQIRTCLRSGQLEEAMDLLIEFTPDAHLLKAQYALAKKSRGLGLVSQEYWDIKCNNIALEILEHIKMF